MVDQPRLASNALMVTKLSKNPRQISRKDVPMIFMPNKPFNCVDATVKAAAEQKPEITGAEMISMMNPVYRAEQHVRLNPSSLDRWWTSSHQLFDYTQVK